MTLVRAMTRDEQRRLVEWAGGEGWNPGLHDAELFWELDPEGYLALEVDGQLAGGGAIIRHNHQFGFMGLFIVRPEFRSRKLGTQLWYARRDRLRERLDAGGTIGLDAVDAMIPFYARGGFEALTRHRRFQGLGSELLARSMAGIARGAGEGDALALPVGEDAGLVVIGPGDLDRVEACDRGCFPGERRRFLGPWLGQSDACALAAVENGQFSGYGVLRRCSVGYKVGPLCADDSAVAHRILRGLALRAGSQPVFVDVPDNNPAARRLCESLGMVEVFGCVRMYLGPVPDLRNDRIFGIATLEVG